MKPWWKGAVLYQIYPRSFLDTNADGVGDLKGVLKGLDHVARLGADGVWLSPFFPSPMDDFGYDVSDYCGVDQLFGSLADFDAVVERARSLGLKVLIDQVYSHTSDRHPWFQESERAQSGSKADWYVWADAKPDGSPPNNWLSVFGGSAWEWSKIRRQYYLHNFLPSQPDLNFRNPSVQAAVLDVARFWLDRGVDGFRLDVANYYFQDALLRDNPPAEPRGETPAQIFQHQRHVYNCSRPENFAFLARLRILLDSYPGAFAVAEIFDDDPLARQIEYCSGADRLHTAYSFHLLLAERATPKLFADALRQWEGVDAWPSWSLGNHDVSRFPSRLLGENPPPYAIKTLLAVLLCMRGTIFLYQGDELGLPQALVPLDRIRDPHSKKNLEGAGRDGARTPFPWNRDALNAGFSDAIQTWLPVDPAQAARAVHVQDGDPRSILHFTRNLLRLRKQNPALTQGGCEVVRADEAVLAFERVHGDRRIFCIFNFGEEPAHQTIAPGSRLIDSGLNASVEGDLLKLPPFGGALLLLV